MTTSPSFSELRKRINQAMLADRFRLRRSLDSVSRAASSKKPYDRSLKKLEEQLDRSCARRQKRLDSVPKITLNLDLPIAARVDEITQTIRDNQVVIVCGETGSGKSTQLPMICLAAGRGVSGVIGHTQPRRIAARSVAARVAQEMKSQLGGHVGFKIRFTDNTKPESYIKLMTDGILLAESQNDRFFEQYDTIIIDEAHERSLNIDFLLGRLKQVLPKRRDLRIIITSATIDAARFAEHFGTANKPAPVINVEGRTFPVEVRYRPLVDDEAEAKTGDGNSAQQKNKRRDEPDVQRAILDAVDELGKIDRGDILIFMPTERDIHETAKSLRGRLVADQQRGLKTEILPLYARLSTNDQNRIFNPGSNRRIVIATNVAESSLTVPGIRYVIDTGTARISRYSSRSRMQRLPIEPISRASADQRAGRCGRVAPGVCVRLYSEADFKQREQFTAPEIQRTNLASVILQTTALRLGKLEEFPFLEPPRSGTITDGYRMLFELGALDAKNQLTESGKKLSRLPVDPRVGRIVLAGDTEDCLNEILIIAAALEMQDPRERPIDQQQAADEKHAQFTDERSDFLSYLKLWDFYHQIRGSLTRSKLRKACQQNFLSYNRMREWVDIHHQLRELAEESDLKPKKRRLPNKPTIDTQPQQKQRNEPHNAGEHARAQKTERLNQTKELFDPIHRALLTGFLGNVALLTDKFEYSASFGQKVSVWPGSGLFKAKPKWIVAGELVETTKRYVRTVAGIKPEWLEQIGGHLIKRTYSDPEWDPKAGSAMAFEKVTLFGLPVIPRRQVRFSRINAPRSREMLIQHGLVEGDIEIDLEFFRNNQRLLEELDGLQTRTRRYDLIADDEVRYEFYDQRIPHDVADAHQLRSWLKKAQRKNRQLLYMQKETVRRDGTEDVTGQEFPNSVQVEQLHLPLEYNLEPGSPEDGVTISVPQEALNQLNQNRVGWLVPGLVEEKVVALIKSLPKSLRRQYVPAAETAADVFKQLTFGQHDFEDQVARLLAKIGQQPVARSDFQLDRLPNHLRMNVRVVDATGDTLAEGRDISQLRKDLGAVASQTFAKIDDKAWSKSGLTQWSFGNLPAQVQLDRNGLRLTGYPSLVDNGTDVSMKLSDMATKAAIETRGGIRRLAALSLRKFVKSQVDNLPQMNNWSMNAAAMGGGSVFRANLSDLIVDRAFFPEKGPYPRTEADFNAQRKRARGLIPLAMQDVIAVIGPIMQSYSDARKAISKANSSLWKYAVDDVKQQCKQLTTPGYLTDVQWGWLRQFPRYLQAMVSRLRKLAKNGVPRDRASFGEITELLQKYESRRQEHAHRELFDPNLLYYKWMIEEYRVSLFAQELGTAIAVSSVRLEKQWEKVIE
jgi:ATP-dependent helicase HrpA